MRQIPYVVRWRSKQPLLTDPVTYHHVIVYGGSENDALAQVRKWGSAFQHSTVVGRCYFH